MADPDAIALLDEFSPHDATLTQTDALDRFCLPLWQLSTLPHEERPNPRAIPGAAPMKLFDSLDVATLALEVHGGAARDLAAARAELRRLRAEAEEEAARRERYKADRAQRSAQIAARFVATTPEQRLCKQLAVDPQGKLTKTAAFETFNLKAGQLYGLPCEEKTNPRNPRFAKMKLYEAQVVARRALNFHTVSLAPEASPDAPAEP